MNNDLQKLKEDIKRMETILVDNIISSIENIDIDINIIESKISSQGKFKKNIENTPSLQIKYEIHFLEESLSLDPVNQKIVYNNSKIGYSGVQISNDYYFKLRLAIISRKRYFEMIDKMEKFKKILGDGECQLK